MAYDSTPSQSKANVFHLSPKNICKTLAKGSSPLDLVLYVPTDTKQSILFRPGKRVIRFGLSLDRVKFGSLKFCSGTGSVRVKFRLIEFDFGSVSVRVEFGLG